MNELPNNIKRVALVAVWGFLLMALAFGYWQVVRAPALRAHPNNPHAQQRAKSIKPGLIYTRDGEQGLDVVLTINSEETARQVAGIMQLSVEEGTASSMALSGYCAAAGPIARQILEVLLSSQ